MQKNLVMRKIETFPLALGITELSFQKYMHEEAKQKKGPAPAQIRHRVKKALSDRNNKHKSPAY